MPSGVVSDFGKDMLQGANASSARVMYWELQVRSTAIAQQMILSNSSVDREVLKLKKELEGMTKERDQSLHANIDLAADNSNLKADSKKFEDREASWGRKIKREKDVDAAVREKYVQI